MSIRQYKPGDEKKIMELFYKVFQQKRSIELWKWKFIDNPEKANPFILVYEDRGAILGHISLWVNNAFINGSIKKVALRVDTMVDPDARGKGIYKKLNEHMLELAEKENITFLYGFPAPKANELFQKYTNAIHMIDMPRWIYVLHPVALVSAKVNLFKIFKFFDKLFEKNKKKNLIKEDAIKIVNICNKEFDELADRTKSMDKILIVRDSSYLNWRYFQHPENKYKMYGYYDDNKLRGYIVYKITDKPNTTIRIGNIVDLIVDDINDIDIQTKLLHTAIQQMDNVDFVQAWSLPHQYTSSLFKKQGFIHKDSPMPLVGKSISKSSTELTNASNWFICMGDVDSY
ncbi:hypothetical protein CIL05_01245 [Virgibacillus profundi]|uniref:N-acetyltransferase domain-containing protein n=1 Tax=Virgibacillus profundi TaxID=2024555 RepID=A0A2A2IJ04_9BACI|nr:GNAT family N-acetyltransferase [Virgibacillus profundi]PAV31306.1 hypothetical protein CIL05_01245 [Virgibacillus profundi]PXY55491.1 GNAT family N-acetyltransferase [Virgibacillus profundi]